MNTTEILTKIKTLLGVESEVVRLAQMKLEDGLTIVESDFEAGAEIMIVTEDGKVAMPVGDYTLEDGRLIVVKEEGLIEEIKEAKEEEVTEEELKKKRNLKKKKNTLKKRKHLKRLSNQLQKNLSLVKSKSLKKKTKL